MGVGTLKNASHNGGKRMNKGICLHLAKGGGMAIVNLTASEEAALREALQWAVETRHEYEVAKLGYALQSAQLAGWLEILEKLRVYRR